MPYRKINNRQIAKKSRYSRNLKNYNRAMITKNPKIKEFYYKRVVKLGNITADADGADTFQNFVFTLADVPNYTDFTNLYDFYKINAVSLEILPVYSGVAATSPVTGTLSGAYNSWASMRIFSAVDLNSQPTVTAMDTIRSYENCKKTKYINGHVRYQRFITNIDPSTGLYPDNYFNTDSSSYAYGCFLIGIDTNLLDPTLTASGAVLAQVEATYYLSFKNPR